MAFCPWKRLAWSMNLTTANGGAWSKGKVSCMWQKKHAKSDEQLYKSQGCGSLEEQCAERG